MLSISWSWPEDESKDGLTWTVNAIKTVSGFFQDAAMLGVTVFVASGDAGSDGGIGDKKAHVLYPASDPVRDLLRRHHDQPNDVLVHPIDLVRPAR